MSNKQALKAFAEARALYQAKRFSEARARMRHYRQRIDYRQLTQRDDREPMQPHSSVIIVSFGAGAALLDCLDSVFSQAASGFEVILVDNGGNEAIYPQLERYPLFCLSSPINFLPSEGRNVGAYFARGKWLIFLDDDALMAPGYLHEVSLAMEAHPYLALRGRILPKSSPSHCSPPKHYDLGDAPLAAQLNLEGNMVIQRDVFKAVGGFDPLMFGHEGREMDQRCRSLFPAQGIYYWPALVIYHDYASEQRLAAKHERQALATEYLLTLSESARPVCADESVMVNLDEEKMKKMGVSILIRGGVSHKATVRFLDSLVRCNTYKPIEAALVTKEPQQALNLIRPYLSKTFVRLLPADTSLLSQQVEKLRYDLVLVVDLPMLLEADALPGWVKRMQTGNRTALACSEVAYPAALLCQRDDLVRLHTSRSNIAVVEIKKLLDREGAKIDEDSASKLHASIKSVSNTSAQSQLNTNPKTKISSLANRKSGDVIKINTQSSFLGKSLLESNVVQENTSLLGIEYVDIQVNVESKSRSQLETTICSITRQNTPANIGLTLIYDPATISFDAEMLKTIRDLPWIERFESFSVRNDDSQTAIEENIGKGAFDLRLVAGDVLSSNSLEQLLNQHNKTQAVEVFGVAAEKGKDGRFNLAEGVLNVFRSPDAKFELTTLGVDGISQYPINSLTKSAICLKQTSPLVGLNSTKKVAVVHEFVCEKNSKIELPDLSVLNIETDEKRNKTGFSNLKSKLHKLKNGNRQIWLFGERSGTSAEENSWIFFAHCIKNATEADCYYVINDNVKIPDEAYQDRVVIKGSALWSELTQKATHLFFNDSAADILLSTDDLKKINDPINIYLTHGVLSYSPGVYQKWHKYIDLVTVTSEHDARSAMAQWGFDRAKFALTGLARWDNLYDYDVKREILFCPTWRKSLPTDGWDEEKTFNSSELSALQQTKYFESISSLLSNVHLHNFLSANRIVLTVSIHFRLRNMLTAAIGSSAHNRIRIHDPQTDNRNTQTLLKDSILLITDYSSIMWDMVHMNKPVILYQFDKAEMLYERGLDSFRLHDAQTVFDICHTEHEVLSVLNDEVVNNFSLSEHRIQAISKYLPLRDTNNCSRILEAVRALQDTPTHNAASSYAKDHTLEISHLRDSLRGKKIAAVVGDFLADAFGQEIIRLSPIDWKLKLASGSFDVLLIEPCLDAGCEWSDIFFSVPKLQEFLIELKTNCASVKVELLCIITPYMQQVLRNAVFCLQLDAEYISYKHAARKKSVDISIIVPAYNSQEHIGECISSLVDQDFRGSYEVIIIDDGGTDNSLDIIKEAQSKYPFLRYYWQPNARQGMARNYGIHLAEGEFVTFVDSDDVLPRNALSELYHSALIENTDVSLGLFCSFSEGNNSKSLGQGCYHYLCAPRSFNLFSWPALLKDSSPVAKLIRRRLLIDNKVFFSKSYHEDALFTALLYSCSGKISNVGNVVYFYRGYEKDTGTKAFDFKKLIQILNVGIFVESTYRQQFGCESKIYKLKITDLIIRYDRFLKKMNDIFAKPGDEFAGLRSVLRNKDVVSMLMNFLNVIDIDLIARYALMHPAFLLLLKLDEIELANEICSEKFDQALKFLEKRGFPCNREMRIRRGGGVEKYTFNYYKPVKLVGENNLRNSGS